MTFKENARLDTSQVGRGRGGGRGRTAGLGGGGLAAGGGVGGLLILVLYLFLSGGGTGGGGLSPTGWDYTTEQIQDDGGTQAGGFEHCRSGADANEHLDCRMIGAVNSIQGYWSQAASQYQPAQTILFDGVVDTGCGTANSQVGPFYCPLDAQIYIDISFFRQLERMGGDGGSLSQMYVVAHEYGHHIQNLTGTLSRADRHDTGPTSDAVRIELQADCYAGVWVAHADGTRSGTQADALLEPVTQDQIDSALSAAAAVGDDRIQEAAQGRVTPESWTHGSAEQRQRWFMTGYDTGDPNACDTFAATDLG